MVIPFFSDFLTVCNLFIYFHFLFLFYPPPKGLAVPDDLTLADGRRVAGVATTVPIIATAPIATRTTREVRGSPQPKRRRREENGGVNVPVSQGFHHGNSPSSEDVSSPSNPEQQHYERHQRSGKVEIHREDLKEVSQSTEVKKLF